jgi:hypothetical protein
VLRQATLKEVTASMTTFPDLAPCRAVSDDPNVLAIAWLGHGETFNTGPVDPIFFQKLVSLCNDPLQPVPDGGWRVCEVCQFDAKQFKGHLFVPYQGKVYVAPTGIVHFIAAHWYQPPQVFIDAVMACPPTRGIEFRRALQRIVGESMLATAS